VTIEAKGNDLHITQSRSKFKLSLFSDGEFPSFPKMDNSIELAIDSMQMINAFREITPSIDLNNPKHELNGASIIIKKDGIDFASTDSRRLSVVNMPCENDNEMTIIMPRKAIIEIQKLFFEDIKIHSDGIFLVIESDNFIFFTKLVSGKFPQYERIIPSEINHVVKINKLMMISAIKQVNILSNDIKLTISNGIMAFSAVDILNNDASTDIEIESNYDGKIDIGVNSKYILDFLGVIYDNEFTLGFNEENLPFVMESGDLKTIVMPIVM
jgi:DNA polymerase-3 subunit beta